MSRVEFGRRVGLLVPIGFVKGDRGNLHLTRVPGYGCPGEELPCRVVERESLGVALHVDESGNRGLIKKYFSVIFAKKSVKLMKSKT